MFEWRWTSWDWNILKHFVKRLAWHYGTLPIEGLPRVWASKPRATSFLDVLAAPQAASMLSRKSPHVTHATWSTWYRNVEGCRGCRGCDLNLEPSLSCSLDHLDLLGLCQVLKFPSLSFSYVFWFFWPWNPIEKCGKRHALLLPPNSNAFRPWMCGSSDRPDVVVPSVASTTSPRNAPGGKNHSTSCFLEIWGWFLKFWNSENVI